MVYENIELPDITREIKKDLLAGKFYWKVTVAIEDHSADDADVYIFENDEPTLNFAEMERLVLRLFDLSFSRRIVMAHRAKSELEWDTVYSYRFDIESSNDHQTNITSELIDAIRGLEKWSMKS